MANRTSRGRTLRPPGGRTSATRTCRCRSSRPIRASWFVLPCASRSSVGSGRLSNSSLHVERRSRSRIRVRNSCFVEKTSARTSGLYLVCCCQLSFVLLQSWGAVWKCIFAHDEFYADWTYAALPTTEMLRMPFAELLGVMRQALGHLHQRIPEVESILRDSGRPDEGATPFTFTKRIHRI
jgi:hypothetical protein